MTAPRPGLGAALRRAWVGYRSRLDEELAAGGFDDHWLPDGRVLRICTTAPEGVTISDVGRALGISRQAASKLVAGLRDRRYVELGPSPADAREKLVRLAPRAHGYLAAQRRAARAIERRLSEELGAEAYDSLFRLLDVLGADQPRMRDYLRRRSGVAEVD